MTKTIRVTGEKSGLEYSDVFDRIREGDALSESAARQAEAFLEQGPENCTLFSIIAVMLANRLSEPLELILNGNKPDFEAKTLGEEKTLIMRGDIRTLKLSSKGRMFIDGNVGSIDAPAGIAYVSGTVGVLSGISDDNYAALVVAGRISSVGLPAYCGHVPTAPPFFVFSKEPAELQLKQFYPRASPSSILVGNSSLLKRGELKGWTPDNFVEKTTELCRRRAQQACYDALKEIDHMTVPGLAALCSGMHTWPNLFSRTACYSQKQKSR